MGSSFGSIFRVTTFGESHGPGVGVVVDGCLPGFELDLDLIQAELDRRKPGQSSIVTQRKEADQVEVLSGLQNGRTLGTPITLWVRNEDARPRDYDASKFRPSHADFAYHAKYGLTSESGGGRSSARETVGRVAAGAIARQLLAHIHGIEVLGWVEQVQEIRALVDALEVSREAVEATPIRCPDATVASQMISRIEQVRKAGDSVGGVIAAVAKGVPAGWGEPIFDKLEADLAKAMLSIPASKGFEVGSGFAGATMLGSEHNDPFRMDGGRVVTPTNFSGGIQGGISNGMPIFLRVAFKPTSTILKEQLTVNTALEETTHSARGRHDPCVLPRAVPVVEAMMALVLVDHMLRQKAIS